MVPTTVSLSIRCPLCSHTQGRTRKHPLHLHLKPSVPAQVTCVPKNQLPVPGVEEGLIELGWGQGRGSAGPSTRAAHSY